MEHCIYVVVSYTGTFLSRTIRWITGAQYSHASLSLESSLDTMYSFGRVKTWNPFWGGFVQESSDRRPFRRFCDVPIAVVAIPVSSITYEALHAYLDKMYQMRDSYHYNYRGLLLAAFHRSYHSPNHYYCSEFVQDLLLRFQILSPDQYKDIVHPIHLLNIENGQTIYEGTMQQYIGKNAS